MAAPKYVTLKAELKNNSITAIKPDAIKKVAGDVMIAAINGNSGGRLTTKTKNPIGYVLTAIITFKGDDKDAPTKLDLSIAITVIAVGATATGFTGTASGKLDGVSKDIEGDAEDLLSQVLKSFMIGKAIPAMK